jgi:hypothetical protein
MSLTDEQLCVLARRVPEFQTANQEGRSKVITACVEYVKRTWTQSVVFNRDLVDKVCAR